LEDFLTSFKTSSSASEAAATSALEGLNIDEDGLSDEYDFVEDAAEAGANSTSRRGRGKEMMYKYMEMLQKVANREVDEILIDLDDLDTVRTMNPQRDSH
jgi:DNA replication licensing factor MCM7